MDITRVFSLITLISQTIYLIKGWKAKSSSDEKHYRLMFCLLYLAYIMIKIWEALL